MHIDDRFPPLTRELLAGPVRHALGSDTVALDTWECAPVRGGGSGHGVFRITGAGHDRGQACSWSMILKVFTAQDNSHVPTGLSYWRREPLAYQSGLLAALPRGLSAPRCFGVVELAPDVCGIWLEDLDDAPTRRWTHDDYADTAYYLGLFNGAYLTRHAQPVELWLSRDMLREYVEGSASAIARLPEVLDHALVRRLFPGTAADQMVQLWTQRATLHAALARLPRTFCHLDAFPRNLFRRRDTSGDVQTVAVDWSFTGQGAIGEELAPLILGSLAFFEIEPDEVPALEAVVLARYVDGLRDAGWHGDERLAHVGYLAAAALRYGLGSVGIVLPIALDESLHAFAEQVMRHSIDEMIDLDCQLFALTLSRAEQAQQLLDSL